MQRVGSLFRFGGGLMGSSVVRDVRLFGSDASEWFHRCSMVPPGDVGNTSVFVDEVEAGDFVARRFWTNQRSWRWSLGEADNRISVVLLVEGRGSLDGQPLHPADAILMGRGTELDLRFATSSALVQMITSRQRIPATASNSPLPSARIEHPRFGQFFLSSLMSLFSEGVDPSDSGFDDARRSVEFAASAVVTSAAAARAAGSSTQRMLFARAVDLIHTRAHDVDLTVDTIIRLLNSSKSNIHRAFDAAGTSPGQVLRNARVQKARGLLVDRAVTSKVEVEELARVAGFRSARSMRAAFAEVDRLGDSASSL